MMAPVFEEAVPKKIPVPPEVTESVIVTELLKVANPLPNVSVVSVPDTSNVQTLEALAPSDQVVLSTVVESN